MTRYFLSIALVAIALNLNAQTVAKESAGSIMLFTNNVETIIPNTKDASAPVIYGSKVYYLQASAMGANTRITSYDVNTKLQADIISKGMKSDKGYVVTAITKMLAITKTGLLYFSTNDTRDGISFPLTWVYDINTGDYRVFSDGVLDSLDDEGNVTVVFQNKDMQGSYTQKTHYTPGRTLIKIEEKQY